MTTQFFRVGGMILLFLAAAPMPATGPAKRDQGDPLPEGAIARLGTTRLRHGDGVYQVVYSPDGKWLASIGCDHTLSIWDATTGRQLHTYKDDDFAYFAAAWSPDGTSLAATGGDRHTARNISVRLLDMKSGKETGRLCGHNQAPYCVAFSPDGKSLLSVSYDLVVRWDVASANKLSTFQPRNAGVVAVAPDCQTLAWVDGEMADKTIHLCDTATGKEVGRLQGLNHTTIALAWSPDSKCLATGHPLEAIHLWEVRTGQMIRRLDHRAGATRLRFSADGKVLASASADGSVSIWDTKTAKELKKLTHYRGWVNGLAFTPDGQRLALAGADSQVIHLWDVASGKERRLAAGHHGTVHAVAYSPDGKFVATGGGDWHTTDHGILLWETATGTEVRRLMVPPGNVCALHFSPDGKLLVSGSEKEDVVRIWNVATGLELTQFKPKMTGDDQGDQFRLSAVAWSPDGKLLASAHGQGLVILWDARTGTELRSFRGHEGIVRSLKFAPNGQFLLSGSIDHTVRLWNITTSQQEHCFGHLDHSVTCVAFSPDGRLIAACLGGYDGAYYLWDAITRREVARLPASKGWIHQFDFSPDGKLLAGTGADNTFCVWEVATRAFRCQFPGHCGGKLVIAFAPDGRSVATGSQDTTVLLWDVAQASGVAHPKTQQDLDKLWTDLGSEDAKLAHRAICALVAEPEKATKLLDQRLQSIAIPDADRLAKALRDLDHDRFNIREQATIDLARLGEFAEPLLRQTLASQPSQEVRHRITMLLTKLDNASLPLEHLRLLRAYEVLELIGSSEARALFETHARQSPTSRLGREAQASLDRLMRK